MLWFKLIPISKGAMIKICCEISKYWALTYFFAGNIHGELSGISWINDKCLYDILYNSIILTYRAQENMVVILRTTFYLFFIIWSLLFSFKEQPTIIGQLILWSYGVIPPQIAIDCNWNHFVNNFV